jgi:RNA polymerase sigma factor (sigma-70 family)
VAKRTNEMQPRDQRDRQAFFAQVGRHLNSLYRYAPHLLKFYEALGDLPAGQIEVEDVVDAAVLGAYRELGKNGAARKPDALKRRLIHHARAYVQKEVRQAKVRRDLTVSKEEDIPETPPEEEAMTLGEEVMYFFEPDEDLKVEDVVPDLDMPTPEEEVERAELNQCVDSALAGLPEEWRLALRLRFAQGLKGAALAQALGKSAAETSRLLKLARTYLKQRLVESGCAFTPAGPLTDAPSARLSS